MEKYAKIIVDVAHSNVDKIFEYRMPENLHAKVGARVKVPFGSKVIEGCVLGYEDEPDYDRAKIKNVKEVIDKDAIITPEQIKLAELMVREYRTTMAFALRLMYPAMMRGQRVDKKTHAVISLDKEADVAALKAECYSKTGEVKAKNKLLTIERLEKGSAPLSELDHSTVKKLVERGFAKKEEREVKRTPYKLLKGVEKKEISYTEDQKNAIDVICRRIDENKKKTILLHGVTGSGKTEVYISAIRHALSENKRALVLVPEISLTPQLYSVFYANFGSDIAVMHSGLSAGEKYDEWRRIISGEAKIVIGARSAVFMPVKDLGIIIIDEEHEQSYRADNHPAYHAADIARWRSALNSCVLVLSSATPRIESFARAQIGMYELVSMPNRVRGLGMPEISVCDMRNEILKGNDGPISGMLYDELSGVLKRKEQAMLFLNRRGLASSVQCVKCGTVMMCSECDIPLKLHKKNGNNVLMCHYCGRIYSFSYVCKNCGSRFIRTVGCGTQRVEEELNKLFPQARVLRMDFDSTRKKDAHREIYESFKDGGADVLIGTQMIARGLDFDNVTLAAVINADTMLASGDFRREEKTFSMIEQVGGRAGRKKPGRVIIQTYEPSHYAIKFAAQHDYLGLYNREIEERKRQLQPPFSTLYRFLFSSKDYNKAKTLCGEASESINALLKDVKNDILLNVAKPAPIDKLDGKSRFHIVIRVIKNEKTAFLKSAMYDVWEKYNKSGADVFLDIDPSDIN